MTVTRGKRSEMMSKRADKLAAGSPLRKATEDNTLWLTKEDPGKELTSYVRDLISQGSQRLYNNIRYFSIYANEDFYKSLDSDSGASDAISDPVTDNQVRMQVDTTAGKLIQANSRISMLTNQGDYSLWKKAQKCEAAIQGEWNRMGLYDQAQQVAKDGLITGNGYLKLLLDESGKKITCRRVFPNEVVVDTSETSNEPPNNMYQMRYASRDVLVANHPEAADVILKAPESAPPAFPWTLYTPGQVELVEAWALPVGERKGRHVLGCGAGTILDEEWTFPFFPFAHFKPADMPLGFYGQGLVSQVEEAQNTLNQMLAIMQEGAALATAPFWLVTGNAQLNLKHLSNVPGHIVEVAGGVEPKWITNAPFHQAAPVYCDLLRKIIADQFGNNAMDTGGELPVNRLDSKRALREYQDMVASHITLMIERWSKKFFVDLAKVTMGLAGSIAKAHGAYPVLAKKDYKRVLELDWKDCDLEADAYMMTPAPSNLLSQTPAGKTQDLIELMQAGLISQKQAQRMLAGPQDANALVEEACAEEEDIDDLIEGFVERGDYRAPNSYQDLNAALPRVARARLQYAIRKLPQEKLALFDRWLSDAEDTLQRMMQQPAPSPPQGAMPDAGAVPDPAAAAIPIAANPGLQLGAGPAAEPAPAVQPSPAPGGGPVSA